MEHNNTIWTHQVLVVVPHILTYPNVSAAYITGHCNEGQFGPGGDLDQADEMAHQSEMVGIVVYNIPNCHYYFPSDPAHKARAEDRMISWAWKSFMDDPTHDYEWLPRLPMTKGVF